MLPAEPDKVRKDDTPRAVMALNGELRIQLVRIYHVYAPPARRFDWTVQLTNFLTKG